MFSEIWSRSCNIWKIAYTACQSTFTQLNSFTQASCPQSSPAGCRIKCRAQVLLRKRGKNCSCVICPPSIHLLHITCAPPGVIFFFTFWAVYVSLSFFKMLLFMVPPVNKWGVSPTLVSPDSYIANQSSFSSINDKDLHYYKSLRNLWVFYGLYCCDSEYTLISIHFCLILTLFIH